MEDQVQIKTKECQKCKKKLTFDKFKIQNKLTCKACLQLKVSARYYRRAKLYKEAAGGKWWLEQYFAGCELYIRMARR